MKNDPAILIPIVVLGALEIETNVLEAALENAHTHRIGGYIYTEGERFGHRVVVGRTGMGSANAAAACALAIDRFKPGYVISQGTAGAHDPTLHQGDIVLGGQVRNIHFISTAPREIGAGINPDSWEYIGPDNVFDPQHKLENAIPADTQLLSIATQAATDYSNVSIGVLGSGDVWNRELDRIRFFHEKLGTSCEDMETFAVAQTCQQLDVPCLCLRVISNSEYHPHEQFDPATAEFAQRFVLHLIECI